MCNRRFATLATAALMLIVRSQAVAQEPPAPNNEYEVFYHHVVRNKTAQPIKDVSVYLPVPQNDDYQQISEFRVEKSGPVHISNRTDAFGNKLKRLTIGVLEPGQSIDVGFSCLVKIQEPSKTSLAGARGKLLDEIPADIKSKYTTDAPIFGIQTPIIQREAKRLMRECPDPVDRAKAIHDFVAGTFRYKSGDGWDRAPEVMERRSGSCTEFSYVFCALCRATGIPTRLVGGSIFPVKSNSPFHDKSWHRWAEAYLPGVGWTPFDPTLDRASKPKQAFVGAHHPRVLILTRVGDKSTQLGLAYIGSNSHTGQTSRSRYFVWSQGLMNRFVEANAMLATDRRDEGMDRLRELAAKFPGSKAADEAARVLQLPASQPEVVADVEDAAGASDEPGSD